MPPLNLYRMNELHRKSHLSNANNVVHNTKVDEVIILKIYKKNGMSVCEEDPAGLTYGQADGSSKQINVYVRF